MNTYRRTSKQHFNHRLHFEHLEDRRMLALVTVNTELDTFDPDDGVTSLREAIFATNIVPGPDDIVFDFGHDGPATILLEHGELEITEALTITGDGPELLTIDAQHQSRIFNITAETGDFTIAGMTLTNGQTNGDNGGAIRSLTTGNLTIQSSTISGNSAERGGGGISGGTVIVTSSTISGNSAEGRGGGIWGEYVAVTSSTISGNSAGYNGGGIWGEYVAVTSSTFSGNSAGYNGGGISGPPLYDGRGGISGDTNKVLSDAITVTSSTISGNSAGSRGGGIWGGRTVVTVTSSTISGNLAGQAGGGILGYRVTVTSSTISGNSAGSYGGGIGPFVDTLRVTNSIVAGNTDGGFAPDIDDSPPSSVEHSLIGDSTGSGLTEAPVGSPDPDGNLIGGPVNGIINPMLGPLANNGGLTFTHALLTGSPAIDAGDPLAMAGVGDVPFFDGRGTPYTRVSGDRMDMGAHERQSLTVDILGVPSPTIAPVDEVTIQFSSATSGLDLSDLKLSLGDGENLLTGSQTLSTSDNQTFVLGGLTDVTTASAYYTLKLISSGSGIVDANGGGPLDAGDSVSWAMGSVLGLTVDTLVDESDGSIDDGDISLRDAVAAAAPGETIDFAGSLDGGTILLAPGEMPLTRSLTIDATALATGLVIDASGNDPTPDLDDGLGSRIFDVDDGSSIADSPVTIRGLTLTGGDVNGDGGAIRARETLTVTQSTIAANSAGDDGGGISSIAGTLTVTSSTIAANSAGRGGGGISNIAGTLTVTSSTILANSAEDEGGGVSSRGHVTVTSSTISGNSAGSRGGGIWFQNDSGGTSTIKNSIVAGNNDDGTAPDLKRVGVAMPTVEYSLIGDNTGSRLTESPVGMPDANGNLIGGRFNGIIDPVLGPLTDNGGPTWTHALLLGSPAIDAGDPLAIAGVDGIPQFDQRGSPFTRVYDGDGIDGARIDMGAFELQPQPGDLNGDLSINFADLMPFALALTDPAAYEAMYPNLDRVFLCDVSGDGLCNFGDLQPFADLLVGGEGSAALDGTESGQGLAAAAGHLVPAVDEPSPRAAHPATSGVIDAVGIRDRALIAWLSSFAQDDTDGDPISEPDHREADDVESLPNGLVESAFQRIGE